MGHLGPFKAIWSHLRPFGAIWGHLNPFGLRGIVLYNRFILDHCCHFFFSGLTPDFFSLSGANTVGAKRGAGPCNMASVMFTAAMDVQINTGVDSTNYYCGGQLNTMSGALMSGVVKCKFYL